MATKDQCLPRVNGGPARATGTPVENLAADGKKKTPALSIYIHKYTREVVINQQHDFGRIIFLLSFLGQEGFCSHPQF